MDSSIPANAFDGRSQQPRTCQLDHRTTNVVTVMRLITNQGVTRYVTVCDLCDTWIRQISKKDAAERQPLDQIPLHRDNRKADRWGPGCYHLLTTYMAQRIASNGVATIVEICSSCDTITRAVPHREYAGPIDELPIHVDYRTRLHQCEHYGCEDFDTERHHWAPRSVFIDADQWPTSYLCKQHHREWHTTTGVATSRRTAA